MDLPVMPPVKPMLAKAVHSLDELPDVDLVYEPKWDGFRCIVFRDGAEVELSSRGKKPLTRYFPEVVEAVRRELPERCVIDGEIVLPKGTRLDFDGLQQRIHPAASRIGGPNEFGGALAAGVPKFCAMPPPPRPRNSRPT